MNSEQQNNTSQPAVLSYVSRVYRLALPAIIGIGVVFASVVGFNLYVYNLVEQKTSSDEFIKRLGDRVRPSLIFDANGTIIADSGALDLIEIPEIEEIGEGPSPGYIITIRPKQYLSMAPFLQMLGGPSYALTAERTKGVNWKFTLEYHQVLVMGRGPKRSITPKFRVEIMR